MRPERRRRAAALAVVALAALALAAAAAGAPGENVLHAHSKPEREIAHLWWVMLIGSGIGFALVVGLLGTGWVRRKRTQLPFGGGETVAVRLVVGLGIVMPLLVLSALFAWSNLFIMRDTSPGPVAKDQMTIHVVGHQWFWEIDYPGTRAVVANEIHIPTHTRVNVQVSTVDVIHSFWVPELNRKIDTIPGQHNRIVLQADSPGVYRGQCTEYCGLQHAHMAVLVFAEPKARFESWLRNQARPARKPRGAMARKGEQVFLSEPCSGCHTIRGTSAQGKVGPDLTHLMTRTTLAGGIIPNRKGYLGGWVLDPQHVKPGNKMPGLNLTGPEFNALLDYLEQLR